jgi:hypothetical protein
MRYTIHPAPPTAGLELPGSTDFWDKAEVGKIESFPWEPQDPLPQVAFRVLYDSQSLYLRFDVREWALHATHVGHQSEVWQDNCVEWFFRPGVPEGIPYLNFEFNCLGYLLLGCGPAREGRERVPLEQIDQVWIRAPYSEPIIDDSPGPKDWTLEAAIPHSVVLAATGVEAPRPGTIWKGNFNKCSQSTQPSHYGSWNPIESPHPDFHRPECFGDLVFA